VPERRASQRRAAPAAVRSCKVQCCVSRHPWVSGVVRLIVELELIAVRSSTLLLPLLSLSRPASPSPRNQPATTTPSTTSPSTQSPIQALSSLPTQFPPRTSSDPGPTVESQGFVLYLGSLILYLTYLFWAYAPDSTLHSLGIDWYPSREWALLGPAWSVMAGAFVYFSYIALNIFITPSLDSLHTITGACCLPRPRCHTTDGLSLRQTLKR
jgi:hypothetical protein